MQAYQMWDERGLYLSSVECLPVYVLEERVPLDLSHVFRADPFCRIRDEQLWWWCNVSNSDDEMSYDSKDINKGQCVMVVHTPEMSDLASELK